jgi:hypothetical protein
MKRKQALIESNLSAIKLLPTKLFLSISKTVMKYGMQEILEQQQLQSN